jgi:hypothetical protein
VRLVGLAFGFEESGRALRGKVAATVWGPAVAGIRTCRCLSVVWWSAPVGGGVTVKRRTGWPSRRSSTSCDRGEALDVLIAVASEAEVNLVVGVEGEGVAEGDAAASADGQVVEMRFLGQVRRKLEGIATGAI